LILTSRSGTAVSCQDGDAALALQLVRVEHPLGHFLVRTEHAALAQQAVDQRRLPMVDVGDQRHVRSFIVLVLRSETSMLARWATPGRHVV